MNVIKAEAMGMCFGVRDALQVAGRIVDPQQVTVYGELVHNEVVLERLRSQGFAQAAEDQREALPATPNVLITAHGISETARDRLQAAGKRLVDTTCPLVRRVHDAAQQLQASGFHVLLIGRRGHVEVVGIAEDLSSFEIIESPGEVRTYPYARLGVICQSTTTTELARNVYDQVQLHNPLAEIRVVDTICDPTRRRQSAMHALVGQVDAVVVVGGRRSNNTAQLSAFCRHRGKAVLQVQTVAELDPEWLRPYTTVGLTAGTSTLPETIEEVYQALRAI